jgi:hypothetical protein
MKKYAFGVEAEVAGTFELFELVDVPDTFANIQQVWSAGILAGNPELVQVSGVSGISSGDSYADGVFTNNSETNSVSLSDDTIVFAIVSNSIVYGFVSMEKNSFNAEKYLAAVESNTIVLDVTEVPNAAIGAIWDGSRIIS